jgi:hypothetical protein
MAVNPRPTANRRGTAGRRHRHTSPQGCAVAGTDPYRNGSLGGPCEVDPQAVAGGVGLAVAHVGSGDAHGIRPIR